jgi:ribokinase
MKEIYILGSLNTDLTVYLDRYPQKGETIKGRSFRSGAGGKGLNQAFAAAKLGGRVHFLGAVGKDAFGEMMVAQLKSVGVDVSSVHIRQDIASGVALIEVCQGENEIALDLGANETIQSQEIDAFFQKAKPGDLFLTQGENNADSLAISLQKAHELGLVTLLNPAPANRTMVASFPQVDLLIPNEREAALLSGKSTFEEAAKNFRVPHVVITLGKDGYYALDQEGGYREPAIRVEAIDTTGAGDAFCGALCYFLSVDKPLKAALKLASVYASMSTLTKGSSASMADLPSFARFLKERHINLL